MKKLSKFVIAIFILIPLIVGFLSSFITKDAMFVFNSFKKPSLSPPGFLFLIVWSILYVLMGISSYLVYNSGDSGKKIVLCIYAIQLVFNFFWSILFFKFRLYLIAFIWLLILLLLVIIYIAKAFSISKTASYLMIPYVLWMIFAGYLNIMIYILN